MTSFQPEHLPGRLSVADLVKAINASTGKVQLRLEGDMVYVEAVSPPGSASSVGEGSEYQLLDDLTPPARVVRLRTPPKDNPVAVTLFRVA